MPKPAGLYRRGEVWHIDKTFTVGGQRHSIRQSTGCREISEAQLILEQKIAEAKEEILYGPKRLEHTFREAAVKYVLSLERRGKNSDRAEQDIKLLDAHIGGLPLSHVHQGALLKFEDKQRGVRRSGTLARAYRTIVAVLNYAARVLRDGNTPWLLTAVPKIVAPDWNDALPPYQLSWEEQDKLVKLMDKKTAKHLIAPVLFGASTGAREQEICGLTWDQEVLVPGQPKGAFWWIPPEIRKGNSRRKASDQSGRYLVCNGTARSIIEGQRDLHNSLVFPGPKGQIGRLNNTGWRTAWRKAGLPMEGYKRGVHNLRHTFGVRLEAVDVPWEYRKVLLGHEISDVTAHYSPPGLKRLLTEAEKVKRETAVILRPVPQNPHSGERREEKRVAN